MDFVCIKLWKLQQPLGEARPPRQRPPSPGPPAPPAALLPTGQNVHISVLLLVLLLGSSFTRGLNGTRWESLQRHKTGFGVIPSHTRGLVALLNVKEAGLWHGSGVPRLSIPSEGQKGGANINFCPSLASRR